MAFEVAADELLGWIIRAVGLLWMIGSVYLMISLRREAMIGGMISKLDRMVDELARDVSITDAVDEDGFLDADAPLEKRERDATTEAAHAWSDRDDRSRRRWLAVQNVLLGLTGLSMAILHPWAAWLVAGLVAAQGVYFIVRERAVRAAPTKEAAEEARPSRSTVNAGWFSVVVAVLVWVAAYRNVLG